MTIEELENKVNELEKKYADLEIKYLRLREWSDENDFWLREMIDALTESVDKNMDRITVNGSNIEKCQQCCSCRK